MREETEKGAHERSSNSSGPGGWGYTQQPLLLITYTRASRPATSQPIVTCAVTAHCVHTSLAGYLPENHSSPAWPLLRLRGPAPTAASNTQVYQLDSDCPQQQYIVRGPRPRQSFHVSLGKRATLFISNVHHSPSARSIASLSAHFLVFLALAAPVRLALMLRLGLASSSAHPSAHLRPTTSLVDLPEARAPSAFSSHTPCPVSPCPSISRLSYRQHSSVLPFLPPLFQPGLRRCVGSWTAQAKTTLISPRATPRDEDLQRNHPVRTASTSISTSTAAPTASMVGLTSNLFRANAAPRV